MMMSFVVFGTQLVLKVFKLQTHHHCPTLKRAKKVSFENANNSHCSKIDKPLTLCNRDIKTLLKVIIT